MNDPDDLDSQSSLRAQIAANPAISVLLRWMPKLPKYAGKAIAAVCKGGLALGSESEVAKRKHAGGGENPLNAFCSACKDADAELKRLVQIPYPISISEEQLSAALSQLVNKEIIISTNGRHKCGKSTLLNALLDKRLLPMSVLNETGVKVKIRHSESIHSGECESSEGNCAYCPKLECQGRSTVRGCQAIYSTLEQANSNSREVTGSHMDEYTLTANVPILAGAQSGWTITILDNPGFGESHQNHMMERTETTLVVSTAFLYILDAGLLQDEVDSHCLDVIHKSDGGILDDNRRFIVVVAQFDKTYQYDKHWAKEDIQKMVCKEIKLQTGKDITVDVVIPVCGKWAFEARQLKQNPKNAELRRHVIAGLLVCPSIAGSEMDELFQLPPDKLAEKLEEQTGIDVLEKKISEVTSECVNVWMDSTSMKYRDYLVTALNEIDSHLREINRFLREVREEYGKVLQRYKNVEDILGVMKQKLQHNSEIYRDILQGCRRDVEATKDQTQRIVDDFGTRCTASIHERQHNFGPEEFTEAINQLLREDLTNRLQEEVNESSRGFQCGMEAQENAVIEVKQWAHDIGQEAETFLNPKHMFPDKKQFERGVSHEEHAAVSGRLTDVFTEKALHFQDILDKVNVPPLELSMWEWLSKKLRSLFSKMTFRLVSPPVAVYKSVECIETAIEELNTCVREEVNRYLQDTESSVAEVLFRSYCQNAESYLTTFEKDYRSRLEQQKKRDELCIAHFEQVLRWLEEEKEHLLHLQKQLSSTSQVYKKYITRRKSSQPWPRRFSKQT